MAFRTEARWKNYGGRAWWGRAVYIMAHSKDLGIFFIKANELEWLTDFVVV